MRYLPAVTWRAKGWKVARIWIFQIVNLWTFTILGIRVSYS